MINIQELFRGVAVIIDDEIADTDSTISRIKGYIEGEFIPVVTYNDLPAKDVISSLSNISFLIIDWDFTKGKLDTDLSDELISLSNDFRESEEEFLIDFIKETLENIFAPIFLFTSKDIDSIKSKLESAKLWNGKNEERNRIFIKRKSEINSESELFSSIKDWLKNMPSVYVLKQWERIVFRTKNEMFIELYSKSPNWVRIIWDMIEKDSIENADEFGAFISRNLLNRIANYTFDQDMLGNDNSSLMKEDLKAVLEGERYHAYKILPDQAYTGDLIKIEGEYYLNIRAQCDISRKDNNGKYNPDLYCIKGVKVRSKNVITDYMQLTPEGELNLGNGESYAIGNLEDISRNEEERKKINEKLIKIRDGIFLRYGSFIENENSIIVGCIDGNDAIKFHLKIIIKKYDEIKDNRIGKLLPPYITRIQQKLSQHIIREGIMPVPEHIYK